MKKRVISLMTSILMIIAMMASAVSLAAPTDEEAAKTETVTLHKILLKDLTGWPKGEGKENDDYDGSEITNLKNYFGDGYEEIPNVYFAWRLKSDPEGTYIKGKAGDLNSPSVNASGELEKTTDVKEAMGGVTTKKDPNDSESIDGIKFNTDQLDGEFEIVEVHELSSYVGKNGEAITDARAVPVVITLPLVNDAGVVKDAHVYPKNIEDKPPIDKDFGPGFGGSTGANPDDPRKDKDTNVPSVNIGDEIPYEVKTKIPANSHYKVLKWTDTMSRGLTYNKDLVIKLGDTALVEGTDYTIAQTLSGFVLKLIDHEKNGLGKINKQAVEQTITLTYTATVNSDAQVDVNEKNDVVLEFGNNPGEENEPVTTTPKDKEITVTKTWEAGVIKKDIIFDLFEEVTIGEDKDWRLVESKVLSKDATSLVFENLEEGKNYKVVERPSGYVPEYSLGTGNGNIVVNNKGSKNPPPVNPDEPKVVTHGKKFVKTNQDGKERLAGAEFVIKNAEGKYLVLKSDAAIAGDEAAYNTAQAEYVKAIADYNTWIKDNPDATPEQIKAEKAKIGTAKDTRDKAFDKARYQYTWGTKDQAYKLVSDNEGRFEIQGLAAGTYNLEEIKPPAGYAKRNGDVTFTVAKGSYDGNAEEMPYTPDNPAEGYGQQVKNKKVDIPQTGGMGTILFTVVGLALMTVAFIALRKRNNEQ